MVLFSMERNEKGGNEMRDYVKKWAKAAAVRAVKTMAQTAAAG